MAEIVLVPPWESEMDTYTLGPGGTWERSMSHNLITWQLPGQGVDGMDLWLDSDTINVTWTWAQTDGGTDENPNDMVTRFASYFVLQRSQASEKNCFVLSLPGGGNLLGWVQSISFGGEGGKGNMVTGRLTFVVNHIES